MNKRALRIAIGDRVIAYHPSLARVMGSATGGIWLSQILYWDSVKAATMTDDDDIWFYKTDAEIIGETFLTRREAQSAKATARRLGLIKIEIRGMPAKTHYCVDTEAILDAIESSLHNAGQQVDTTPGNKLTQIHAQNLPQSTTEMTESTLSAQGAQTEIQSESEIIKNPESESTLITKARIAKALQDCNASASDGQNLSAASETAAAVANPRDAERRFIKTFAPLVAECMGHAVPTDTDKSATRRMCSKGWAHDWLTDRLRHYSNGGGEDLREKPNANAYWLLNRIDDDWANRAKAAANSWDDMPTFRS